MDSKNLEIRHVGSLPELGPSPALTGRAERIEAISCRYELHDRSLYPVAGTMHAVLRDGATGWEPEHDDTAVRFVGYVVTVKE